ncbi:exodeoxyribonuclease V subunit beta [Edwardsiella piscicida]|uniref:exodeoxyribonuclease V subunit beta n=1 Tax=Edwardsiella piscicida TaxID=1263550 RepID=UPI0020C84AAF|nr:exodeoxyribonuclease V subunit beta [Edwardsiella piscicida]WAM45383.1 exodeoxyribonuclease V subunit beta [Edwardsiella piscicida]
MTPSTPSAPRAPMPTQTLDPLTLPLRGARLIEASAGTGKTFTLAALYLRLLLGLGEENAYPRPLAVEEILVVTFTEAATEELRGRIRSNIHALRLACLRGESGHPLFANLLAQIADRALAASLLLAAERQMDEAAIYTIHGFCQRMLSHNAFESGVLFQQTLLQDELPLRRQACADFWRRHCYPLSADLAAVVSQLWSGPEALLAELQPYLSGEMPRLRPAPDAQETLAQRHQALLARIERVKAAWREHADQVAGLIAASGVDKRSYSSRYLPKWLDEMSAWAQAETRDYQLPSSIARFAQATLLEKTSKGAPPCHSVFTEIEALLAEPLSLRDLLLARALGEIRDGVQLEKRRRAELGFDDLLTRLDQALGGAGGEALAATIRQRYPVAMIDEFQDTDPLQYRIFQRIYAADDARPSETALLLIGDPKQAIYAFRGADIFTYLRARAAVDACYTLETNWRSTPGVVQAVNALFLRLEAPFLFAEIPFLPVASAAANAGRRLTIDGEPQSAMALWLYDVPGCTAQEYLQTMARRCAAQIRDWLSAGQRGSARLIGGDDGEAGRALCAADMTILVRSRHEATVMRDALSALNIPSVYLSNRDSVFSTPEARDLLWLLQAILTPAQSRTLRSALAVGLLGLDAAALDALSQDERRWDAVVDEFDSYRRQWQRRGVLPMLRELIGRRRLAENLLATAGGERRLTDVLHLGELLQEAAAQLDSEPALVRWLAQQIDSPQPQAESQQMRLESDRHLVQVITIHKSKGLEFPLVFLPFVATFRRQRQGLYHDRVTHQAVLDLSADDDALALADQERLAEDLRLLYVAVTRAVYHCALGIAPLVSGNRRKQDESDLHHGAIGYLLQRAEPCDAAGLKQALQTLSNDQIRLEILSPGEGTPWQAEPIPPRALCARRFTRRLQDDWRVTSYSALQQHGGSTYLELLPRLDIDAAGENRTPAAAVFSAHTFPRGAAPGTFLHSLLETLDFAAAPDPAWLAEQCQAQGIDLAWVPTLAQWLTQILQTPLDESGLTLSHLAPSQRQPELQFYLPIARPLRAEALDALIRRHDALSAQCDALTFSQVEGMLKGFIDLVFCHQGRYYLLDYKSNWLSDDRAAYSPPAMAAAMIAHRYDLQYQLYTLALHRYLRHRLVDYDYQRHFGGVFYCFLRGMAGAEPGQGVFACRPEEALVTALDALFAGEQEDGDA